MEFTSKADLVRELNLCKVFGAQDHDSNLSNVLLEASGERLTLTATDLG